jgi:hypothetical protein
MNLCTGHRDVNGDVIDIHHLTAMVDGIPMSEAVVSYFGAARC